MLMYRNMVYCKECFKCGLNPSRRRTYTCLEVMMLIIWVQKLKRSSDDINHVFRIPWVFTIILFWVNLKKNDYVSLTHFSQGSFVISKAGLGIVTFSMQVRETWEDAKGFYWKYSTMHSYKLCGHLIPFNTSHSSKVLTFLCHGETFQCIKCQRTLEDNLHFAPE